nr:hypothetical protein [uncultured Arsenicibacter sp.]
MIRPMVLASNGITKEWIDLADLEDELGSLSDWQDVHETLQERLDTELPVKLIDKSNIPDCIFLSENISDDLQSYLYAIVAGDGISDSKENQQSYMDFVEKTGTVDTVMFDHWKECPEEYYQD